MLRYGIKMKRISVFTHHYSGQIVPSAHSTVAFVYKREIHEEKLTHDHYTEEILQPLGCEGERFGSFKSK